MPAASDHPEFWQDIYAAESRPGWDMDGPTPLVPELLAAARAAGVEPGPAVAVPGCGFGHDAAALADLGFQVTGLDFAASALAGARARYGDRVRWCQEDWFAPGGAAFDVIFDHTCFVAMDPARRPEYVAACARRLRPGGLWLGAFFHRVTGAGGPPHPIAMDELRTLAETAFRIHHLDHARTSHPRRAGREFLMVARVLPGASATR